MTAPQFTAAELTAEAERLFRALIHVDCVPGRKWDYAECARLAPLTLEINTLKRARNAIILAHSYVEPDIVYGVSDYRGDSYYLSRMARDVRAGMIVFAGVVFMAETAKILSPHATVVVPDRASGCSLADSLTGAELRRLKNLHPDAAVVCYVNSSAEVKAESDVCVTSGNAADIVAALPERRILFVPDRLMADNLRVELRRRGLDKEIVSSDGTCIVHEQFVLSDLAPLRRQFPGVRIVAHPECAPDVAAAADFVGNTESMMRYVRKNPAPYFVMLTECGLVARVQSEDPEKRLVGGCRLCPYMKMNSLEKVRDALVCPRPDQVVTVDEAIRLRAAASLERMFELAPPGASRPWNLARSDS
ncbi:MAG TPA: quinolinate synthase NadA [Candidatus Didemnitutus sp.]|jgi:quinolinate synthase